MTMEANLHTLLSALCPRTYPDVAPSGAGKPWVTWQAIGGESLGFLNNTAADKRNTLVQINVWATTRMEALALIRSIESAMRASTSFIGTPQGEPMSTHEQDTQLYGCVQRFTVISTR